MVRLSKSHGDDVDFLKEPLDVGCAYDAGGGLRHGRYVNILMVYKLMILDS